MTKTNNPLLSAATFGKLNDPSLFVVSAESGETALVNAVWTVVEGNTTYIMATCVGRETHFKFTADGNEVAPDEDHNDTLALTLNLGTPELEDMWARWEYGNLVHRFCKGFETKIKWADLGKLTTPQMKTLCDAIYTATVQMGVKV
jgi:hypothetical protein